jgi:hypothetical protein
MLIACSACVCVCVCVFVWVCRLYTPYQLRSVLQLMGQKQLRAHEVTRVCVCVFVCVCVCVCERERETEKVWYAAYEVTRVVMERLQRRCAIIACCQSTDIQYQSLTNTISNHHRLANT